MLLNKREDLVEETEWIKTHKTPKKKK